MDYLNFKLQGLDVDGSEKTFSLSDFKGKKVVLYFYPKDSTPGCTREAVDFRDNMDKFSEKAVVIGVSPDNISSHLKFRQNQKINFIMLSDPEHLLINAFEVWGEKSMYGRTYFGVIRSTFVLGENGFLLRRWRNVKVKGHVEEVLANL